MLFQACEVMVMVICCSKNRQLLPKPSPYSARKGYVIPLGIPQILEQFLMVLF